MKDSMIERMARAIADGVWGVGHADIYFDPRYAENPDVRRVACVNAAHAVLDAMREPTEAMTVDAADHECISGRATSQHVWRAMIDAALAEGA